MFSNQGFCAGSACSVPLIAVDAGDVAALETYPNISTFDLAGCTKNAHHGLHVDVVVDGIEGDGLHRFWFVRHTAKYATCLSIHLPLAFFLLLLITFAVTIAI